MPLAQKPQKHLSLFAKRKLSTSSQISAKSTYIFQRSTAEGAIGTRGEKRTMQPSVVRFNIHDR
jgi:hypothetical protein